jgi:hypothetical protein
MRSISTRAKTSAKSTQPTTSARSISTQPTTSARSILNRPKASARKTEAPILQTDRATTSAQTNQATTSNQAMDFDPSIARDSVEILDFGHAPKNLPRNVYTEFYDIFPVEQPNEKNCTPLQLDAVNKQVHTYRKRKYSQFGRNRTPQQIENAIAKAKKQGYVVADDGVTQFTIKAYHGVKRGEKGCVYQVAVQFSDNTVRWVNHNELQNAKDSIKAYFKKLNTPNEEINPKHIELSLPKIKDDDDDKKKKNPNVVDDDDDDDDE